MNRGLRGVESIRGGHRDLRGRGRGSAAHGLIIAIVLLSAGCSVKGTVGSWGSGGPRGAGFQDARTQVQVVTTNVGGKNIYIPSTIVLTEGSGRSLSFFNTTDTPHGLSIPGLGISEILPPGEEYRVELPPLAGGVVHAVGCHLHPPHRGATLVVLPAR